MSSKFKFQISRMLDDRIRELIDGSSDCSVDFSQVTSAYILGFKYGNVTNYVGLTTNYKTYHTILTVLGIVFFKEVPSDEDIQASLKQVQEDPTLSLVEDNTHFLIYTASDSDEDNSKKTVKKIYNYSKGSFLDEQPKLSVLEDVKILAHSSFTKIKAEIKLRICKGNKLFTREKIIDELDHVRSSLAEMKFQLSKSNYSTSTSSKANTSTQTESLYDYLDVPNDVAGMGDYLPQVSKAEKVKLVDKWRNKVKAQRIPLEVVLEHNDLITDDESESNPDIYVLSLELFLHLHVGNTIAASLQDILKLVRNCLHLAQDELVKRAGSSVESKEFKLCTLFPPTVGHLIYCCYRLPVTERPEYQQLVEYRRNLHQTFLVPLNRPYFRYSQRITNVNLLASDEQAGYLCNVHSTIIESSSVKGGSRNIIRGKYTYHHYMQDRTNDNGWGCAYRSLQTIISWFKHQGYIYSLDVEKHVGGSDAMTALRNKLNDESRVPTHEEIQKVLVDLGDKQENFIGSQKWIGSQEVCYVLNHLYNLDSKFISVSSGSELVYKARDLGQHFAQQSTPVMIGGGVLAHTIIGTNFNEKNGDVSYLILDPHYTGSEDLETITKKGWCGWKKNSFWDKNAFYNLCLPQRPNEF